MKRKIINIVQKIAFLDIISRKNSTDIFGVVFYKVTTQSNQIESILSETLFFVSETYKIICTWILGYPVRIKAEDLWEK